MHYYIDGYNLMFRVLRAGDDLTKQREQIIVDLSRKVRLLGLHVTLVFDAQYKIGESTRSHLRDMEVRFTDYQETADDFILNELKQVPNPQQHTVITSDKTLAWLARRKSAKTETVEAFLTWLNKSYKNKLRHQKQEKEITPQVPPRKKEMPPEPVQLSEKASAEECFDFYLQHFEKEAAEVLPPKTPRPQKMKRKSQKPKKAKEDQGSVLDYWLTAFERNPENDEGQGP